ncbi:MAG: cardiolipin synthase [Opitutaceae bacterium]|nr:cardiolipin synthase [Opitutaceae bacterium]
MGPLLGAEFVRGNSLKPLINGTQIFPAMLEEIRRAEKSITLESYIWASGTVSDQFCAALIERARAGVKVHALVDGAGNLKLKLSDVDRMKAAGVEFVVYGRERAYHLKLDINHRSHRKLLIVDGKVGFTGGVCIDDTWLGDADHEGVWRDTQARIEGPVVRQMQAVFATNWLQTTSRLLIGPDYFPELGAAGPALAQCFMSGPDERPENARLAYLLAIAAARKSIRLSHAYFAPDDLAIEMLIQARQRGVKIEVIVPFKNDSRMGRAASRSRWGKLLAAGVEFHQFLPALYHCKMMIVDDFFVTLGSVNFDNRSFSINDEVNINVLDASVARACLVGFNDDLKKSKPLTKEEFEARPLWVKALDHLSGLFRSQF